jgi:hypothetical protein
MNENKRRLGMTLKWRSVNMKCVLNQLEERYTSADWKSFGMGRIKNVLLLLLRGRVVKYAINVKHVIFQPGKKHLFLDMPSSNI